MAQVLKAIQNPCSTTTASPPAAQPTGAKPPRHTAQPQQEPASAEGKSDSAKRDELLQEINELEV
eukprot:5261968-Pyramimonas_sp.AAC.1